jgi:phage portal protein BeeE
MDNKIGGRFYLEKGLSYDSIFPEDKSGDGGLWDSEIKAFLDAHTLKGTMFNDDWVFIVLDLVSDHVASCPLVVKRKTVVGGKEIWELDSNHSVNKLLENPNPFQDYHSFMYNYTIEYNLMGNAINWFPPSNSLLITIPAENVILDFDGSGNLIRYLINLHNPLPLDSKDLKFGKAPTVVISKDEILHQRRPNPASFVWGLSPFIPTRKSILFNRYTQDYLNSFYLKGATPGLILTVDKAVSEQTSLRLLRSMELAHTGRRNQRRAMVLPKGVEAENHTPTIADQKLIELDESNRNKILNALKVPKHAVSLAESGSLGSQEAKQAVKFFFQSAIIPTQKKIAAHLTKEFRNRGILTEDEVLCFDTSHIEALQEDLRAKAELGALLKDQWTLNEIRELWNKPALDGGDNLPGSYPLPQEAPSDDPSDPDGVSEDSEDSKPEDEEVSDSEEDKSLGLSNLQIINSGLRIDSGAGAPQLLVCFKSNRQSGGINSGAPEIIFAPSLDDPTFLILRSGSRGEEMGKGTLPIIEGDPLYTFFENNIKSFTRSKRVLKKGFTPQKSVQKIGRGKKRCGSDTPNFLEDLFWKYSEPPFRSKSELNAKIDLNDEKPNPLILQRAENLQIIGALFKEEMNYSKKYLQYYSKVKTAHVLDKISQLFDIQRYNILNYVVNMLNESEKLDPSKSSNNVKSNTYFVVKNCQQVRFSCLRHYVWENSHNVLILEDGSIAKNEQFFDENLYGLVKTTIYNGFQFLQNTEDTEKIIFRYFYAKSPNFEAENSQNLEDSDNTGRKIFNYDFAKSQELDKNVNFFVQKHVQSCNVSESLKDRVWITLENREPVWYVKFSKLLDLQNKGSALTEGVELCPTLYPKDAPNLIESGFKTFYDFNLQFKDITESDLEGLLTDEEEELLASELFLSRINLIPENKISELNSILEKAGSEIPKKTPPASKIRRQLLRELEKDTADIEKGILEDLFPLVESSYNVQLTPILKNQQNAEAVLALKIRDSEDRRSILSARGLETFANISRTTTNAILGIIQQGVKDQATIDQISSAIAFYFREITPARSLTIARTEVLTAISLGKAAATENMIEAFKGEEIFKVWLSAGDARVRDSHVQLDGDIKLVEDPFDNGLQFPRDPSGPPEETINCRCDFLTVPESELQDLNLNPSDLQLDNL